MARSGYSGDLIREEGGSVLGVGDLGEIRMDSGASQVFDSGASMHNFGTMQTESGGVAVTAVGGATCVASSGLKIGQDIAASGITGVFELADFGNGVKFFLSKNSTGACAAGSPGSLLIHLADGTGGGGGSGARLYMKVGDNSPASGNWKKFNLDLASS